MDTSPQAKPASSFSPAKPGRCGFGVPLMPAASRRIFAHLILPRLRRHYGLVQYAHMDSAASHFSEGTVVTTPLKNVKKMSAGTSTTENRRFSRLRHLPEVFFVPFLSSSI
jgi:hypothetical protein